MRKMKTSKQQSAATAAFAKRWEGKWYGFSSKMTELEYVAALFKRYAELVKQDKPITLKIRILPIKRSNKETIVWDIFAYIRQPVLM